MKPLFGPVAIRAQRDGSLKKLKHRQIKMSYAYLCSKHKATLRYAAQSSSNRGFSRDHADRFHQQGGAVAERVATGHQPPAFLYGIAHWSGAVRAHQGASVPHAGGASALSGSGASP